MASDAELAAFFDQQTLLLTRERDAEIERTGLLLSSCSPKLLERKGLALGALSVASVRIGLGGKSLIELERPSAYHTSQLFPSHTFRPGDLARIEEHVSSASAAAKKSAGSAKKPGSSTKGAAIAADSNASEGVVFKVVTDSKIIIAIDASDSSEGLDLPELCRVLKLANSVTYDRMDRAIETARRLALPSEASSDGKKNVASSQLSMNPLVQVLLGITKPSDPLPTGDIEFLDTSLNDSQKEAVKFTLQAPEVALIHGPPGTGKTHTLVEIIRQLVKQGKRLLVCGASNLAVDNLLERLIPHGIPLTRIGHPARILTALHNETLDAQAARSDESALAKDVKNELEAAMNALSGKGKGRLKGAERKKMWNEVKELRKEYRKREGSVVKNVMAQAKIVLATCHSSGGRQLQNTIFDVVLIDEATQALEAVCWIPILKGKKLILAGDPLQLPPTIMSTDQSDKKKAKLAKPETKAKPVAGKGASKGAKAAPKSAPQDDPQSPADSDSDDSNDSEDGEESQKPPKGKTAASASSKPTLSLRPSKSLEVTLFDRLEKMYGNKKIKRMLTVQYRMHATIAAFPSKTLYKSALISHESVASHLLKDLPETSSDPQVISEMLEPPVVFFDTAGCEYFERLQEDDGEGKRGSVSDEGSRCNENEATVVKNWVEKLVNAGLPPSQIAVITPYQAQVALLSTLLKPTMPDLEIGTVDGMQGREKEAIVLSLVRSNDKREVGFLKEKRRLNVAMTRPRRHLCVVGDSSTVSQGSSYLKKWMAWLEENAEVVFGGLE
ncbi:P-loop containing nucleoside triphosphate hydrolase protein [Clavulina sp. PMI_390]|nr:P-loop containing nucleoside triphosphate hydrolase protein [Clavulina sp. PMI_390]